MFDEILRVTPTTLSKCLQTLDIASALHQIEIIEIQLATTICDVVLVSSIWQNLLIVYFKGLDTRLDLHMTTLKQG